MEERLQKIISAAGLCSRRAAEALIAQGRVTVNGRTAVLGGRANPECDRIKVDGKSLTRDSDLVYIMLNKPRGYVSTLNDEQGRRTVAELVRDAGARVYPCGRLDLMSEGLLILTNDGEISDRLTHPAHEVKKIYRAEVSGEEIETAVQRLRGEFRLDGRKLRPAEVSVERLERDSAVLRVAIGEGRNRQIRRMCTIAGLKVKRLCRVAEGELKLGNLPAGQWRYLNEAELRYLREL
ncbi:MAG: rRNA pseudouridine synthase [Firmicutes bacterium]|nr:rRNA pseudouridine synthase [Bacillota bacterium]